MSELIDKSELQKYGLDAEELLRRFREQLSRDFEMSSLERFLPPLEDSSYESIHLQLSLALEKIALSGTGAYQNLLYRTDISEKQCHKALKEHNHLSSHEVIAELIIKRVLQKVILKIVYSK
jgi:hypothetical protein